MKLANPVPTQNYQPHIDGLRALAIIPVFLYHLNPSYCSGGFGGVDVFFVISGYLISLGIFKNLDRGTFSLLDFYDKRIRRIIPIYTFTILIVLLVAPFILYPEKLYDLARMAVSGTFFVSNIDLYLSQNYFTQSQLPNPLTNLWSLSVEEQFYMFLPLLLILIYKFARKYILLVLTVIFLLSFSLILYHTITYTLAQEAFYLLPFRMYELLTGTFLAYFALKSNKNSYDSPSTLFAKFISFFAFASLLITYYLFSKSDLFPSLWAFTLCIFAIILIKYGNAGITGYILKSRPFVFIGRISYSIYLIHYPIIILWKFENFNVLSNNDALLIFILTIVISTITWVFIELPIRFSKTWTRKKSFILFLLSMLSIILISRLYYLNDNLFMSSKLNLSPVSHYTELESPKIDTLKGTYLNVFHSKQDLNIYNISSDFNNANTLLVGDSHCQALIFSLTEEFKKNNIKALYISDFLSIAEYKRNANYNSIFIESLLDYLRNNSQIKNIIIINRWKTTQPFYFKIERFLRDRGFNFNLYIEERETGYLNMIKDLNNLGLSIFVTSTAPEPVCNIVENRYRPEIYLPNSNLRASKEKYNSDCVAMEYMFSVMQNSKLAKFIRIEKSLEEGNYYKYLDENSNLLYFDDNHLSLHGARIVAPYLVEEFLKLRDE